MRLGVDQQVSRGVDQQVRHGVDQQVRRGVDQQVRLGFDQQVRLGVDQQVRLGVDFSKGICRANLSKFQTFTCFAQMVKSLLIKWLNDHLISKLESFEYRTKIVCYSSHHLVTEPFDKRTVFGPFEY